MELLQLNIGDAASQQAVEALCALVALRIWASRWNRKQITLRVRSDSISALILVLCLKTSGKATGIIAREMALDIAAACYPPMVAQHVPGVANKTCDVLSRRFQPGTEFKVPALLKDVPETELPVRTAAYYKSAAEPPLPLR